MLIGILSGTYSSIYNASPILYLWDRAVAKRKGPGASITELAKAEIARHTIISTSVAPVSETQPRTPGTPPGPANPPGRTYGQVRRRASAVTKRDDDLEL
jgi:hypothetical protein